jgi:hypothetical protein
MAMFCAYYANLAYANVGNSYVRMDIPLLYSGQRNEQGHAVGVHRSRRCTGPMGRLPVLRKAKQF